MAGIWCAGQDAIHTPKPFPCRSADKHSVPTASGLNFSGGGQAKQTPGGLVYIFSSKGLLERLQLVLFLPLGWFPEQGGESTEA